MSTLAPEKVFTGMGATPHESGVAFRVWAPHADAVYGVGSFKNDRAKDTHPMEREGEGDWDEDTPQPPSATSIATASSTATRRCCASIHTHAKLPVRWGTRLFTTRTSTGKAMISIFLPSTNL